MITKSRLRSGFAVLALFPLLFVGTATDASAAFRPEDCPKTYACWWVDINYGGNYYASLKNQGVWPEGIAHKDSAVFNNGTSGNAVFTYKYGYNIETVYCVRMGVKVSWLGNARQDKGKSHDWKATNSGCL